MYRKYVKRIIDVVIAFVGLIICFIPMVVVAICVAMDSDGGAFFKQTRLGINKKKFTMYKFRSMVVNEYSDCVVDSCEDDPRITKIGAFIRKTSIDELPQLWNILKGEMSIIGPRPMLPAEYEEYKSIENIEKRFSMRPGLFCTVDVEYRAEATPELQMQYDAKYIEKCSCALDVKCMFGVLLTVLAQKNVYKNSK
ncbi:MAG: sugar transferase [Tyzzerella sp.]|nr:sugar transferase [Tyzzerella sp.]